MSFQVEDFPGAETAAKKHQSVMHDGHLCCKGHHWLSEASHLRYHCGDFKATSFNTVHRFLMMVCQMHITLSNNAGLMFEPSAMSTDDLDHLLTKALGLDKSAADKGKIPW